MPYTLIYRLFGIPKAEYLAWGDKASTPQTPILKSMSGGNQS